MFKVGLIRPMPCLARILKEIGHDLKGHIFMIAKKAVF
jgi:hypothetical protein